MKGKHSNGFLDEEIEIAVISSQSFDKWKDDKTSEKNPGQGSAGDTLESKSGLLTKKYGREFKILKAEQNLISLVYQKIATK